MALKWNDVSEGMTSPVYTEGPITRTDIVKYAGSGGDFNPIHHDEEFAKSAGLPSIFSMGLYQGGLCSRLASDWLGLANIRHFGIRLRSQVWPGETLKIQGTITRKFEEGGEKRIEADLIVTNADGTDVKIQGRAVAAVTG